MAILAGYFDDSGTHKESAFVVVAGGVASVQQWTKLSSEWESATRPWNLSRGYFHMADFVSGFNDYAEWSENQKKKRLHQLIQIICEHVRVLVCNAVVHSDFKTAFERCPNKDIGTAYRFCAFLALPAVDRWRRRSPRRKPVALIFESGNKLKNELGQLLSRLGDYDCLREQYGISSLTEGSKKDMPPLQAADVIAYATYKCLPPQKRIDDYLSEAFERLFKLPKEGLVHSDPDRIEKYLRQLELPRNVYNTGKHDANAKTQTA